MPTTSFSICAAELNDLTLQWFHVISSRPHAPGGAPLRLGADCRCEAADLDVDDGAE